MYFTHHRIVHLPVISLPALQRYPKYRTSTLLLVLENIDKTYRILSYTRIKPRSRPLQNKKSAYFTHPDFSAAKLEKKCANYGRNYGIYLTSVRLTPGVVPQYI